MPLHIPLRGVQVYDYVGTEVVHSHDAEVSELDELDGAYVKKKEITLGWLHGVRDEVKVAFDLKSESLGVPVYARLYLNGAEKGVQQSESGLSYVTKTETLSGLTDLDKIQLYLHGTPSLNLAVAARTVGIRLYSGITDTPTELHDTPGSEPAGLTFDGLNLISCDKDLQRIYVHDGISDAILNDFASPNTYPSGLTIDGSGNLISCDTVAERIYVHDGITDVISRDFASPQSNPFGLTFDGVNLISCDPLYDKIYVHDGVTEAVLSSFDSPYLAPNGLTFDGVNLISCDSYTTYGKIYIHDGISDVILLSFNALNKAVRGLAAFHYPATATAYARNFRIIGGLPSLAEKLVAFENTL